MNQPTLMILTPATPARVVAAWMLKRYQWTDAPVLASPPHQSAQTLPAGTLLIGGSTVQPKVLADEALVTSLWLALCKRGAAIGPLGPLALSADHVVSAIDIDALLPAHALHQMGTPQGIAACFRLLDHLARRLMQEQVVAA